MYRFRTIENILGKYKELENQEIYFASLEELNDPIEGYLDIFWQGDEIIWKNFLKHYILCLEHVFALTIISKKNSLIDINSIPILKNHKQYPTPSYKEIIVQILEKSFKDELLKELPENLAKRKNKIRRHELLSYLRLIHYKLIDIISIVYHENKLLKKPFKISSVEKFLDTKKEDSNIFTLIDKSEKEFHEIENLSEKFFSTTNSIAMELDLISSYNNLDEGVPPKYGFILKEFPDAFLTKAETMVYPEWFTACFMSTCENSSVWGNYADKHRGVCLIFKTKSHGSEQQLDLETEYGYNDAGPMIGMRPHTFQEVIYENKHVEIDFFRNLGRLQVIVLKSQWYTDDNGNISSCAEPITDKSGEWIKKHHENYKIGMTTKLDDWDYENEFRLVITNMLNAYHEKENRKLKYDFNDLEGIIFGMKTLKSHKLDIMRIIEKKCKQHNRKEFSFYQAFYNSDKGKIDKKKLNLLKFD